MERFKLKFKYLFVWFLENLVYYWNCSNQEEHFLYGLPIYVRYQNEEEENLPLDQDIKIGRDGMVYLKDHFKNKWMPYPEIKKITFDACRMSGGEDVNV